ncbi:MAG: hypothetical protein H6601_10435 [Flavobacteriales bacterium]|nr:hypothetical protein [Flavobacteriales bacterium]
MINRLSKLPYRSLNKPDVIIPSKERMDPFKLHLLNEVHAQIMVVVFLASAFTIFGYFSITLISILEASKWFAAIGLGGFLLAYLVRIKLRLSLLDGLFYSVFGIAPSGLAVLLMVNAQCTDVFTETYRITNAEQGGSGYTLNLENNALDAFWHIRNLDKDEANLRLGHVQYTFCNGVLGYKVMKGREMVP